MIVSQAEDLADISFFQRGSYEHSRITPPTGFAFNFLTPLLNTLDISSNPSLLYSSKYLSSWSVILHVGVVCLFFVFSTVFGLIDFCCVCDFRCVEMIGVCDFEWLG